MGGRAGSHLGVGSGAGAGRERLCVPGAIVGAVVKAALYSGRDYRHA